jgi:hypothetical protein
MVRLRQAAAGKARQLCLALLVALTAACSGAFIAPYDEGIVDGLTAFQEDVGGLLLELEGAAPDTPFADYRTRYTDLEARLDALLTRSVVNAEGADPRGIAVAERVNALLARTTDADPEAFAGLSLSAAQIHDLRTLLRNTRAQHEANDARSAGFWSIRKENFDRGVASALTLERFKQEE